MSGYDHTEGKPLDGDGVTTGKKSKKKKAGTPGKAAGTDNYGQGGPNGNAAVPGKASSTDQLPAGANGAVGPDGKKLVQKNDGGAKAAPTAAPKADAKTDPPVANGKTNGKSAKAAAKKTTQGKDEAKAVEPKAAAKPQADHDISVVATTSMPVLGKSVAEPQMSVVPDVAAPPPVMVAPLDGDKADPTHEGLKSEVASLNTVIKANRDEILALSKTYQQQVASTLEGHAAAIDAKVTAGSKRVVDAYDGIGKAITDSATKTQGELKKREESIPQVIQQTKAKKLGELDAISKKTKEDTAKNIKSPEKVQAAHKVGLAFVQDVEKQRALLKTQIETMGGPSSALAKELNPKKAEWAVNATKGAEAREKGVQALAADKQLALLTKSAKDLQTGVDTSMNAFSKRYSENGLNLVQEVLAGEDAELQPSLDIRKKEQEKSLDEAGKGATDTLKKQIESTRTTLDKTTKDATVKVAAERKPAEEGAKRAGDKLSENIRNGAKEIGNQIAKKAAADAKTYDQALEQLRRLAGGKKLTPATKQQIDALKDQLSIAHTENKKALEQLATSGIAEMKSQKEHEYEQAIVGYEQAATKTKTDLVTKVGGVTGELTKSFDSIGTSFDSTVAQETTKLQKTLAEYTAKTSVLPDSFQTQLAAKLQIVSGDLTAKINEALKPEGLKEGLRKEAEPEIKKAIKQGPKDAQTLWKAMDGVGTDENAIFGVLRAASPGMVVFIEGTYNDHYDNHATGNYPSPLRADLDDELSGDEWDIAFSYLNHDRETAIKKELDDSRGYFNDEEDRIEQVLRSASDDEIKNIMASPDGKQAVEDVKGCLSSCDLHVVEALTDVNNLGDRKIKADAIRLYDAMHGGTGIGTDEAKVKAILEACTDDKEREKLRAYYNTYYVKSESPIKLTDEQAQKVGATNDFLTDSLDSEFSSGERTYVMALNEKKRDEQAIKMAKLIDAAAGGGTDENKLFESLDDEEYKKKFEAANKIQDKAAREKALNDLVNAREDMLNTKLAGLKSKALGFGDDTVGSIIRGESGSIDITYQELLDLTWSTNDRLKRPNPGQAIDPAMARMLAKRNLEAMVAQRKLAAGFAEPELMLMYACHGAGTDEEWTKKALSKDEEPLTKGEVAKIKSKFKEVWGGHEALAPDQNELETRQEPKSGLLKRELDGKEWFDVRVLLMGKPETPDEIGYVDNVRYAFVTSGSVAKGGGETSPWSRARADMDHSHKKLQDEVAKANTEKKDLKDFDAKDGLDGNRLEVLAEYSQQSEDAYLEAVESFVDAIITIIELIGAALITIASMGASSPFLVAFIGNLILSGMTIMMRKEMVGDAVGTDQMMIDAAKAVVMAAVQAAPEAKWVGKFTEGIGTKIAGKLVVGLGEAAQKGGMRLVGTTLEISEKGAKRIVSIATASVKAAGSTVLSETAGFLMDEKTYDMKFGEAIWGENSLGARLAKGLPQAMVKAAVNDLISDAIGISNLRHRGSIGAISKHALYSAIAEMGGETAGFFVYLDNYADAGTFWEQLLRTNAKAGLSGTLTGIAMHRGRAKKLGRDFINAHLDGDAGAIAQALQDLHEATGYMHPDEKQRVADFIAKEKPELVKDLPDDFKKLVGGKQPAPAANTNTNTAANTNTNTAANTSTAKADEEKKDANEKKADAAVDETQQKKDKPVVQDDEQKKPVVDDEQVKKQQAQADEEAKQKAKAAADAEEAKKQQQNVDEEKKKAAVPTEEEQQKKQPTDEEQQQKQKQQAADEEKQKAAGGKTETPAFDPAHKANQQQVDQGHAGIEVHSHFMGNVAAESMRDTIGGKVPNQVSQWEPLLAAIDKLPDPKNVLRHQRGEDGKVEKRGASGDALELVSRTRDEIAKLKRERTMAENATGQFKNKSKEEREARVAELTTKIDQKAELAVKKALAASDETDFNSSYEIRDELIKGYYGAEARKDVVAGTRGDVGAKDLDDPAKLLSHFDGRPEVKKKIDEAAALRAEQRNNNEEFKKDPKKQKRLDDLKQEIQDQFAYDEYAKQTLKRLAEDNIKYTEQSNSSAKLGKRFDGEQVDVLRAQLIAEQQKIIDDPHSSQDAIDKAKKLQQQLKDIQIANLSMVNTSMFGERDTFADGTKDTYAGDKPRPDDEQFKKLIADAVAQVGARKDVVGIDIAGAENFRFDDLGRDRMIQLHAALMKVATPEHPVVLRPHVGEGAWDPTVGEAGHRDKGNKRTADGELQHYDRARANISKMLEAFQSIADAHGGKLPPNIIVRFGHVTHATPEQAAHMARLGIIAEVNLTSNIRTGAVDQNPGGDKKTETAVPPKEAGRLDDHSLGSLIYSGADIILSTDAHEVMTTDLKREYDTAKGIIEDIRSNKNPIRVSVEEARAKGWTINDGPPPHGEVFYRQLDGDQKKRFDNAYDKMYADANKYYNQRPKQEGGGGGEDTSKKPPPAGPENTPAVDSSTGKKTGENDPSGGKKPAANDEQNTAIRKPQNEAETADANKIQSSTDIVKNKLGLEAPEMVPAPDGKPILKQSPSDALIGLPADAISATAKSGDAIKQFQEEGIPRWGALSEKERQHETKFANEVEANLPAFVDQFLAMSKDGETYKFEVDGAKKLYAAYGKAGNVKDGISDAEMDVRATANHALHPTAVAIARLAFLKRLDTMQAGEQIFVTNGGCASGKGSLFGVAEAQMGKQAKFGAVWDAAGEGDAQENMWILKAAQARGLKVTYGFVDNNPSAKYEGVLDRAMSTGRIVDPTTFARSYARGLDNMIEFMNSPEYKDMVAKGQVQTFGVDGAVYKKDDPKAGGLMGENSDGRINASDLEAVQKKNMAAGRDEVKITEDATAIFEKWLKDKKEKDPNFNAERWREGGGTNALKFGQQGGAEDAKDAKAVDTDASTKRPPDAPAKTSATEEKDKLKPPPAKEDASTKQGLIDQLASNKGLAEQHAHFEGSVPAGAVLNESPTLSTDERGAQIAALETQLKTVQDAIAKANEKNPDIKQAKITDLRNAKDGAGPEVDTGTKVTLARLKEALDIEQGLLEKLVGSKKDLQTALQTSPVDEAYVRALRTQVTDVVMQYQQHLEMRKGDFQRYPQSLNLVLEFFQRYRMITGHSLSPRDVADQRPSSGELGSQELRVGIGGDKLKTVKDLEPVVEKFNDQHDEKQQAGDKTDVSLIINTTKKRTEGEQHQEEMAGLIDKWNTDPQFKKAISGIDNAGVESEKHPPTLLWKMSAKRAFMNAQTLQAELTTNGGLSQAERGKFIEVLARVTGTDMKTAEQMLQRFETSNFAAANAEASAKSEMIKTNEQGHVDEAFAGLTIEQASVDARQITEALRVHRAETGNDRQLPAQLGYTIHAGEQLSTMSPFELLKQVEQSVGLGVDRIGHGLILTIDPTILVRMKQEQPKAGGGLSPEDVERFKQEQKRVLEHVKKAGVTVEMNITSNTEMSNLTGNEHPAADMVKKGLKVTVSTDNETVFATTVSGELSRLAQADSISRTDIAMVVLEGFRSRMGSRELPNRAELRSTLFASLMPDGLGSDAKEQLAKALAERFHVRYEEGKADQTVQRVLDVVLGVGG